MTDKRQGRVFIVQEPTNWNPVTQRRESKFDMAAAALYGDLQVLLGSDMMPLDLNLIVADLHQRLSDYGDNDYILPAGNPAAIGMATAIAALYNEGRVQMLVWYGRHQGYVPLAVNLYDNGN